ncbi:lipopolysaccharide assembly protein LapB [Porticoccus sp. W117]|uniref:lipopolysaccharide assembly protein LapB n=1 Tax=Porticoccus sp. W117 TaxID=3054777 RepID=UPI002592679B|nr:lipopolysaccharide assembly protein LapB [Porticoccus sp. W117]MDM3872083.1 lipopolysaccharide assembly protein LapB [Porticoccus sp. W117]
MMGAVEVAIVVLASCAALLTAWYLGTLKGVRKQHSSNKPLSKDSYFRGLNFLLNEEPDESIDTFIHSLEVNSDTLETHMALGALMRRRGEVERAIRIHQNLLSHPRLNREQLYQVQLELARDFMQAGLLDRAERLMLDLAEMSDRYRQQALEHLLEIYRDEQEWQNAIGVADRLWPRRRLFSSGGGSLERGHFCCELAQQALQHGDSVQARQHLRQALKYDKSSVRASLLLAQLDVDQGNCAGALKRLERIPTQDHELLPEAVDAICRAYQELGREKDLVGYLRELFGQYPTDKLLLALAEQLKAVEGEEQAIAFLREQLDKKTSLPALLQLMHWERPEQGERRDSGLLSITAIQQQLAERHNYRCRSCGFSAQKMHWLCPTCKQWGAVKPNGH